MAVSTSAFKFLGAQRPEVARRRLRGGYGLGVVFDPHRARNGITFTNHVFALMSIAIESTAFGS